MKTFYTSFWMKEPFQNQKKRAKRTAEAPVLTQRVTNKASVCLPLNFFLYREVKSDGLKSPFVGLHYLHSETFLTDTVGISVA